MIQRGLVFLIAVLGVVGFVAKPDPAWKFETQLQAQLGTGEFFETVFDYTSPVGTAHAPAIVSDGGGDKLIWFDGLKESHNDVKILSSNLSGDDVGELMSRQDMSSIFSPRQTILTLGNTIGDTVDGAYFTTVVTLGGWAAASIAHVTKTHAQKLNLSPIIARSHLIKSPVITMQGNKLLVPAYFELSNGYGVAVLLNSDRRVLAQSIMRGEFSGIQPMIVPLSHNNAVALLRRFDTKNDRLLASWTTDGGAHWTAPSPLKLPNPNAPVAAVPLDNGQILMLYNDDVDTAEILRFATSSDGGHTWSPGRVLDGPGKGNLRYPMMKVRDDGRILATYSTHGKKGIVAHIFSADWAVKK